MGKAAAAAAGCSATHQVVCRPSSRQVMIHGRVPTGKLWGERGVQCWLPAGCWRRPPCSRASVQCEQLCIAAARRWCYLAPPRRWRPVKLGGHCLLHLARHRCRPRPAVDPGGEGRVPAGRSLPCHAGPTAPALGVPSPLTPDAQAPGCPPLPPSSAPARWACCAGWGWAWARRRGGGKSGGDAFPFMLTQPRWPTLQALLWPLWGEQCTAGPLEVPI